MSDNRDGMLWGSLIADAISMGPHWVYDLDQLNERYGRVSGYTEPDVQPYHHAKSAGDFSHLGDQEYILLESMSASGGVFDLEDFSARWQQFWVDNPEIYVDAATKVTRRKYAEGLSAEEAGSNSDELAGAGRIAPVIYYCQDDPEALMNGIHWQTRMTHNNGEVLDAAEFFAYALLDILGGVAPAEALDKAANREYADLPARDWTDRGLALAETDSVTAVQEFGQSCPIARSFPSVIQITARYQDDYRNGVIENVMAGGDSAARGLLIGAMLGAWNGIESIPAEWIDGLSAREAIVSMLNG